jgi:hypothetical protein
VPQRSNVVPRVKPLTEQQFRSKWLRSLSRLCDQHGDDQVALWLGVGERHLRNLKGGVSLPSPDKIWNLLAFDDSAHDELDGAYDLKNVNKDAACSVDPLTLDMIALAHETAEAEAPDSPGGIITTDHELLAKDEARLRKVYRTLGDWLHRIEGLRRPRQVA